MFMTEVLEYDSLNCVNVCTNLVHTFVYSSGF